IVVTTRRMTFALPTTATPTAETIFSKVSANHAACSVVIVSCRSVAVMRSPKLWGSCMVAQGLPASLGPRVAAREVDPVAADADGHRLVRAAAVGRGLVRAVPREARAVRPPRVVLPRRAELHRVRPRRQVLVVEGQVGARVVRAARLPDGGAAPAHRDARLRRVGTADGGVDRPDGV